MSGNEAPEITGAESAQDNANFRKTRKRRLSLRRAMTSDPLTIRSPSFRANLASSYGILTA
jgi:hypothetical protein